MRDLYSVLNLSRRASGKDIKAAYWALAKQFHPDVNARDQEAEGWTKAINHAYEILGNPDARAAYDLELARLRTTARRSFWRSAATGAATFILIAGSISMGVVWIQHASQTRSVKNETLFAKAPAQEQAATRSDRSEHPKRSAEPSEPISAPLPGPSEELPASTSLEITSTAPSDGEAQTPGPAPSSVIVMEQAPKEVERGKAPSEPSRTDLSQGQAVQRVPQATDQHPPRRTELANVGSPEAEAKQPGPTATVDQKSSSESPHRDGDRKAEAVGSIHKSKKRLSAATDAATTGPNKLQGSERKPRLVTSGAMALRWPSADEPFVNLGARNR